MAYISAAARHGFSRIFTCLLSVNRPKEEIIAEFKEIINHAKDNNMEVILDVAPAVFVNLVLVIVIIIFAELGADGIRLDLGFDGLTEAKMTNNPYGLKIELNVSNDIAYLEIFFRIKRISQL